MYITTTTWIEAKGKKLGFQSSCKKHDIWMRVEDGKCDGGASFHFDADGLRQFTATLKMLEREMLEKDKEKKKEEVKVK